MEPLAVSIKELTKCYPLDTNKPKACMSHLLGSLFGRGQQAAVTAKGNGYFTALDNISFRIPKGCTFGIIGLNGSGKSTLLQILAGTLRPTSGTVQTNGKIAAILELGSGFNPDFTGRENIDLNSTILGIQTASGEDTQAKIIEYADIGEFIDQPVRTYSSGMLVRLAFSVSIHADPEILIIDEALAVGDARFQAKCFQSLVQLQKKGKTILFVSHDSNTVAQICDHALLLHHGQVRAEGDPGAVINDYSKILTGHDLPQYQFYPPKEKDVGKQQGDFGAGHSKVMGEEPPGGDTHSDEYNYGGQKGEIKDFKIFGSDGMPTTNLASGEVYTFEFVCRAKEKILKPIFALKFRNPKRQEIYGTNTLFSGLEPEDMEPGDQVKVQYRIRLNLVAGAYFVSLGFTRIEGEEIEVIERRWDLQEIHVHSSQGAFGIAYCQTDINVVGLPA